MGWCERLSLFLYNSTLSTVSFLLYHTMFVLTNYTFYSVLLLYVIERDELAPVIVFVKQSLPHLPILSFSLSCKCKEK